MVEISRGLENRSVFFKNDVDKETLPNWWTYIPSNIPGPGMDKDKFETGYGNCECAVDCDTTFCTCTKSYREKLGLILDEYLRDNRNLKPVIECGLNCQCNPERCSNRVVQNGIQIDLYVFKTNDGRGFGVKTKQSIQRGAFVCEYAGEIISKEEAAKRFSTQSDQDSNYIHVLKEHFSNIIETIIDPTYFGNVGRFINHSCGPNLTAIPIRAVNIIPRLCFFANIDILPDTELSYNYGGDLDWEIGSKICKCKSTNCKKFLPYDKNI